MKCRTLADLVVAVTDRVRLCVRGGRRDGPCGPPAAAHQIPPIEVQQVEDEIDKVGAAPPFRGILDQRERGDAVRPHSAELAVEIGLPRR